MYMLLFQFLIIIAAHALCICVLLQRFYGPSCVHFIIVPVGILVRFMCRLYYSAHVEFNIVLCGFYDTKGRDFNELCRLKTMNVKTFLMIVNK